MPPQEEDILPAIAIPVTSNDLRLIRNARNVPEIGAIIIAIVADMPNPRAYVCDPSPQKDAGKIWDIAYDLAITRLCEEGYSVVDGRGLQALVRINILFGRSQMQQNPFLHMMLEKDLLDAVVIPGHLDEDARESIQGRIKKCHSTADVWPYNVLIE